MEWYIIVSIILIIVLMFILGMLISCMLIGQGCTISLRRQTPNHELTRIQQEKQTKFGTKFKEFFSSSKESEQPVAPVEDIQTLELSLKLHDEQITKTDETIPDLLTVKPLSAAERKRMQKNRDKIRKKYNL